LAQRGLRNVHASDGMQAIEHWQEIRSLHILADDLEISCHSARLSCLKYPHCGFIESTCHRVSGNRE